MVAVSFVIFDLQILEIVESSYQLKLANNYISGRIILKLQLVDLPTSQMKYASLLQAISENSRCVSFFLITVQSPLTPSDNYFSLENIEFSDLKWNYISYDIACYRSNFRVYLFLMCKMAHQPQDY